MSDRINKIVEKAEQDSDRVQRQEREAKERDAARTDQPENPEG